MIDWLFLNEKCYVFLVFCMYKLNDEMLYCSLDFNCDCSFGMGDLF